MFQAATHTCKRSYQRGGTAREGVVASAKNYYIYLDDVSTGRHAKQTDLFENEYFVLLVSLCKLNTVYQVGSLPICPQPPQYVSLTSPVCRQLKFFMETFSLVFFRSCLHYRK